MIKGGERVVYMVFGGDLESDYTKHTV